MLIIPIEGKISWRNPPIITISLIVINCIVFFFFQAGDTKKTKDAMTFLFRVDLEYPDKSNFHDSAPRLLAVMLKNRSAGDTVLDIYKEYMNAARCSRLSPDLAARLAALFFESGHIDASERIVAQLINSGTDHPTVPTALFRLIRGFEKLETEKKVQEYSQILSNSYPMSHEAQMLKSNLKQIRPDLA